MTLDNVSRRDMLRGFVGTGGLVLGLRFFTGCASPAAPAAPTAPGADAVPASVPEADLVLVSEAPAEPAENHEYDVFLSIDTDGVVTIVASRSEMGTGIRTVLPMVLADELRADFSRVSIEQALGDRRYGSQNTDGSRSIRNFMAQMRQIGATARTMLERAAAEQWGVPAKECKADLHDVVHGPSGRRLGYGELAGLAVNQSVPAEDELQYVPKEDWRYIGKDVPITDLADIVTGKAVFGLDIQRRGMLYASIERAPVLGGQPVSVDASGALAMDGVTQVIELPPFQGAPAFNALGGVAVLGKNTWSVLRGRRALLIEWDPGTEHRNYDSAAFRKELLHEVGTPGRVVRERGDVDAAFKASDRIVEAEYYCPHLAHAPMEPPCAVAEVTDDGCEVWAPTQNPQAAQMTLARAFDMSPDKIKVHVTLLGGGFGRKSKPDYIMEAALLARQVGRPVMVVWTREDDIRHDYFHTVAAMRMKAALDGDGLPTGWLLSSTYPSIGTTFNPAQRDGGGELGMGLTDVPFDVPNLRIENGDAQGHVRIGWLRSVGNVYHTFAVSSFADELAAAAGKDPVEYLLAIIGSPRDVDPSLEGAEYGNYGEPLERYPIDTGRLRDVIARAAELSGWGRALPAGHGLGIAAQRSFLSYVATVVEVAVDDNGKLTIPRVDVVIDCGLAVHPDRIRAQMEGSVIFGLSLGLTGEITAEEGRIVQGNFDTYPVMRSDEAPGEIRVHIVENDELPGGVGEPGVPPVAPALCNAIFAATGHRIRDLPVVGQHGLTI